MTATFHARNHVVGLSLLAAGLIAGETAMTAAEPPPAPAASFAEFDRRATAGEPLTVVFFGGSLTWGANASDPNRTSWRGLTGAYLRQRYPKAPFVFHDAAIGGTGSDLGLFRLDRDVLVQQPALVFLDFTVNDDAHGTDLEALATYEQILRELIGRGIPVVQVLLGGKWCFLEQYAPDTVPRRVAHLALAKAYGTAVADSYPVIQQSLVDGTVAAEAIWPFDSIHPDDPGYQLIFQAVRDAFDQAVRQAQVCQFPAAPLHPLLFANRQRLLLVDRQLPEGWQRTKTYRTSLWYDGLSSRWMDDVVRCESRDGHTPAPLTLEFDGTMVALFGEADENGLAFRAILDGTPLTHPKLAPEGIWTADTSRFGKGRLFIWRRLANNLPPGRHTLVIEPVPHADGRPGQLRLESLCVAGPKAD